LTVYADTSVCVSPYVQDSHSQAADELLSSGGRVLLTPLHLAEWAHAVAQHVFRGSMPLSEAERVTREFHADRAAGLWLEVGIPENAFSLCADLARRYGPKLGVRTLDSLHVACALELKGARFLTFDQRQAKLAKTVGLKTS
jgi:predicted nucleic acid-binding protein